MTVRNRTIRIVSEADHVNAAENFRRLSEEARKVLKDSRGEFQEIRSSASPDVSVDFLLPHAGDKTTCLDLNDFDYT